MAGLPTGNTQLATDPLFRIGGQLVTPGVLGPCTVPICRAKIVARLPTRDLLWVRLVRAGMRGVRVLLLHDVLRAREVLEVPEREAQVRDLVAGQVIEPGVEIGIGDELRELVRQGRRRAVDLAALNRQRAAA